MASARPRLQTSALPILDEDSAQTVSPARGRETRNLLLSKLRPPPLVHVWDFWHEKPSEHSAPTSTASPATPASAYTESRLASIKSSSTEFVSQLTHLHPIIDVRTFWSLYNNISFDTLPTRHSIHLFHAHVKPLWEDPRNTRGGCWTFRVSRAQLTTVFQAVCLLAIGEQLQEAVFESERKSFKDDICGVSFRQRINSGLVLVWNRDAGHVEGIKRIRECVDQALRELDVKLQEGAAFYKAHAAHEGFSAVCSSTLAANDTPQAMISRNDGNAIDASSQNTEDKHATTAASVEAMEREVEKVKRILEEVQLSGERMEEKIAVASKEIGVKQDSP